MTKTDTVKFTNPTDDDDCTLCDKPAVIVVTLTPHDFASTSCNFCGGERAFCAEHWLEFQRAVADARPYSDPTKKEEPVILTGNRPEDNASQTAKGLVQSSVPFPSIPSVGDYISGLVTERKTTPGYTAAWLTLKDGSRLSVQASRWHYCSPRTDDGPWDEFEVGTETFDQFPELVGRAETGSPVEGASVYVYPYVPAKIIGAIIARCGGVEDQQR